MTAIRTDRLLRALRPLIGTPLIGPIAAAITTAIRRHRSRRHLEQMLTRAKLRWPDDEPPDFTQAGYRD